MQIRERVANNIKKYRKQKGLTQEEFAEKLGIPTSTLANYETNRREPNIDTLVKVANFLEVELNTIIFGEPELKAEIFIKSIEAYIVNYMTDEGSYDVVDGYTVKYEIANGYDSLEGTMVINEEEIEIESLKERIREKVREILK